MHGCGQVAYGQRLAKGLEHGRAQLAIKSDASQAGIDITLQGETFNSIIGQAAPCAPMGSKCSVQVFAYGGWSFDGPGFVYNAMFTLLPEYWYFTS